LCIIRFFLLLIYFGSTASTKGKHCVLLLWRFVSWRKTRLYFFSILLLFVWSSCSSVAEWINFSYAHHLSANFILSSWKRGEMDSISHSILSNIRFVSLRSILCIFNKFRTNWNVSFNCSFGKNSIAIWARKVWILFAPFNNAFWLSFCVLFRSWLGRGIILRNLPIRLSWIKACWCVMIRIICQIYLFRYFSKSLSLNSILLGINCVKLFCIFRNFFKRTHKL